MKELTARKISLAVLSTQAVVFFALILMRLANDLEWYSYGDTMDYTSIYVLMLIIPIAGIIFLSLKFKPVHYTVMILHLIGVFGAVCACVMATFSNAEFHSKNAVISSFIMCFVILLFALVALAPQIFYIFLRKKCVKKDNNEQ